MLTPITQVDQAPNRLETLLSTISVNRISVIGASAIWFIIVGSSTGTMHEIMPDNPSTEAMPIVLKGSLFALILLLGILENLSASGNMLSMERDWVVVASSPDGKAYDLTHLNSAMRRFVFSNSFPLITFCFGRGESVQVIRTIMVLITTKRLGTGSESLNEAFWAISRICSQFFLEVLLTTVINIGLISSASSLPQF
jgi:hypothetical protein